MRVSAGHLSDQSDQQLGRARSRRGSNAEHRPEGRSCLFRSLLQNSPQKRPASANRRRTMRYTVPPTLTGIASVSAWYAIVGGVIGELGGGHSVAAQHDPNCAGRAGLSTGQACRRPFLCGCGLEVIHTRQIVGP
jgi:hypothetical protein